MSEAKQFKYIGTRSIRPDGFDKVTGRANYGADMSLPGMIWGRTLRSPHAHAKIKSIDTSAAEVLDGVFAIATHADLPAVANISIEAGEGSSNLVDLAQNVFAKDKVLYHGHAILAVAARTEAIAEQAIDLIKVEYEVLKPVLDVRDAMAKDAPILHDNMFTEGLAEKQTTASNVATRHEFKLGDVEAGFAAADVIVERDFYTPTVHQGYIEPHACLGRYDENGQSMIFCCTQGH
ncbi:MAG: CO/xanthine dehydrogenase Mo-binding subunit, partial [Candidatus Azotimanducaceae bacterium]